MAHYALLDDNNVVIDVFTGRDEDEQVEGITDWEAHYSEMRGGRCLRTSYNTHQGQHSYGGTPFRLNYASVGFIYDESLDGFIPPKTLESWVLDASTGTWVAPIAKPNDGLFYSWDEDTLSWVQIDAGS